MSEELINISWQDVAERYAKELESLRARNQTLEAAWQLATEELNCRLVKALGERDSAEGKIKELEAACAGMREALNGAISFYGDVGHYGPDAYYLNLANKALSPTAGKEMVERYQKMEKVMTYLSSKQAELPFWVHDEIKEILHTPKEDKR